MDQVKLDSDDDSDDSDYEYEAGDTALYDSNFDSTDEIKYLRDSLIYLSQMDQNQYQITMSLLSESQEFK